MIIVWLVILLWTSSFEKCLKLNTEYQGIHPHHKLFLPVYHEIMINNPYCLSFCSCHAIHPAFRSWFNYSHHSLTPSGAKIVPPFKWSFSIPWIIMIASMTDLSFSPDSPITRTRMKTTSRTKTWMGTGTVRTTWWTTIITITWTITMGTGAMDWPIGSNSQTWWTTRMDWVSTTWPSPWLRSNRHLWLLHLPGLRPLLFPESITPIMCRECLPLLPAVDPGHREALIWRRAKGTLSRNSLNRQVSHRTLFLEPIYVPTSSNRHHPHSVLPSWDRTVWWSLSAAIYSVGMFVPINEINLFSSTMIGRSVLMGSCARWYQNWTGEKGWGEGGEFSM